MTGTIRSYSIIRIGSQHPSPITQLWRPEMAKKKKASVGLTKGQKKLPPGLQKAILAKKRRKK